ncbi:MAG: TetR/AcrR family transcriptional regulator [Flavipsychrobacter sp.]|nr:TetR/AcrR family transcriptional regulator [Flavipsychrobacter sp.]
MELYNANGVEYVGMRELAAALGVKLGNITYYFPTKEDIIRGLSEQLSGLNTGIITDAPDLSVISFLTMLRKHCENQVQYKCLFISFVNLMKEYPSLSVKYKDIEKKRKGMTANCVQRLIENKYLKKDLSENVGLMESLFLLIMRFWVSEAEISLSALSDDKKIDHYLDMIAHILQPYATNKGLKEIELYLNG